MYWTTVEKTIVCPVWEVRWGTCIPLLWLYVSKWTRSIFYLGACSAFSQLCTHFSFVLWVYVFCKPKLKNSNFFPALDREVECPQVDGLVLRRCVCCCLASQGAQWGRICRLMQEAQEMQVRPLGQEDPLEEDTATHSSILAWKIPWTEEPCGLQFTGSQRVGHNWTHTHPWNPKNADVFPIPSRCFLLPKTRKGEHLSRESQVTKFSSPASTPFKS